VITITRGIRVTTFASDGTVLSVIDFFGPTRGTTRFEPPEVWADPEVVAEARARLAAVDEPRRRKKPVRVAETGQSAMVFGPVSAKPEGG
jgi:hypothetical protein